MMIIKIIFYSKLFFYSIIDLSEKYLNLIIIYIFKDLIIFEFVFFLSGWKKYNNYIKCVKKRKC